MWISSSRKWHVCWSYACFCTHVWEGSLVGPRNSSLIFSSEHLYFQKSEHLYFTKVQSFVWCRCTHSHRYNFFWEWHSKIAQSWKKRHIYYLQCLSIKYLGFSTLYLVCVFTSSTCLTGHGIWVWQYDDKKKPVFDVPGSDGKYLSPFQAAVYLFLTMIIVFQVTMKHLIKISFSCFCLCTFGTKYILFI